MVWFSPVPIQEEMTSPKPLLYKGFHHTLKPTCFRIGDQAHDRLEQGILGDSP